VASYIDNPEYLTPSDENSLASDFSVLVDRKTIRNIAQGICNRLRHPVTVLDLLRMQKESVEKSRIDSDIEYFSLRSTCRLLRHCAGRDNCIVCDAFHAGLLADNVDTKEKVSNCPAYFYDGYSENPPKMITRSGRTILEYHCPILGYRELLFPFYYKVNEKTTLLIGVLFIGQTVVVEEGDKDTISRIAQSFFKNPANAELFDEFLKSNNLPIEDAQKIKDAILSDESNESTLEFYMNRRGIDDEGVGHAKMTFLTKDEYYSFIDEAVIEVNKMELEIAAAAQNKRLAFFEDIVHTEVRSFFLKETVRKENAYAPNALQLRTDDLRSAWENFLEVANSIKCKLGLKKVLLFGEGIYGSAIEGESRIAPKKIRIYPLPAVGEPLYRMRFNYSKANDMQPTQYDFTCSLEDGDILEGIERASSLINRNNMILIAYTDMVVLIEAKELNENRELYKDMSEVIGKSFSRIRSVIALCSANLLRERHILTLRMNRHESLNISTRLNDNVMLYFGPRNEKEELTGGIYARQGIDKRTNIACDMSSAVRLISNMAGNIGLVTGTINEEILKNRMSEAVDVPKLMYKWQVMFRRTLAQRNLDIVVSKNSRSPRFIKTNRDMFELLIYNLVDNAVKYAYRGSVIRLEWDDTEQGHRFAVTSYGPRVKRESFPFELYARGQDVTSGLHPVHGDGIGLYVVKRVEKLLGIKVDFDSDTMIFPCNLPLLSWFLSENYSNDSKWSKQREQQIVFEDYVARSHSPECEAVINRHDQTRIQRNRKKYIAREYLAESIDRETWETTFWVLVPKQTTDQ